jgi:hypothetical protein
MTTDEQSTGVLSVQNDLATDGDTFEYESVLWSDLFKTQKYLGCATGGMLRGDVVVTKACKLDGQFNDEDKEFRAITYNRDFVVNQLSISYRFLLTDCTEDEWLSVCAAAYAKFDEPLNLTVHQTKRASLGE